MVKSRLMTDLKMPYSLILGLCSFVLLKIRVLFTVRYPYCFTFFDSHFILLFFFLGGVCHIHHISILSVCRFVLLKKIIILCVNPHSTFLLFWVGLLLIFMFYVKSKVQNIFIFNRCLTEYKGLQVYKVLKCHNTKMPVKT